MNSMNYVGLDVHKKSISYCVRQADGTSLREGRIVATRQALDALTRELPQPWTAGMEATMFTGWIYDHLQSGGATVKVAHSAMVPVLQRPRGSRSDGFLCGSLRLHICEFHIRPSRNEGGRLVGARS